MAPTRIRRETRENAKRLRRELAPPERKLWQALKALKSEGFHFRRQAPIGPYIADFAWLKGRLIVELDGETHFQPAGEKNDLARDRYMTGRGFRVLRFTNLDVVRNTAGVIEMIFAELSNANRHADGNDQ